MKLVALLVWFAPPPPPPVSSPSTACTIFPSEVIYRARGATTAMSLAVALAPVAWAEEEEEEVVVGGA